MKQAECFDASLSSLLSLCERIRSRYSDSRVLLRLLELFLPNLLVLPFYLSRRDNVPSDRIMFEQAGAGISLRGTVRYYLAGVRRYTPYIILARSSCKTCSSYSYAFSLTRETRILTIV